MNKEEILMKSRKEKKDEGMIQAENHGREIGISAFCLVFIFVYLFNFFTNQPNHGPFAMFWAFMAAEAYPKYRFSKSKAYLVTTIAGSITSIISLLSLILQ